MRFAPETLWLLLLGSVEPSFAAGPPTASASPAASPSPSPSPTASPRYKLIPYGFESVKDPSGIPLLRFEDKTEVRSLEMNAAIARFFDHDDDKGNMLRGATPGGAPTLTEMKGYRPHMSPSLDLLSTAYLLAKEIKKQIDKRQSMEPAEPSPTPVRSPSPSPTPSPKGATKH